MVYWHRVTLYSVCTKKKNVQSSTQHSYWNWERETTNKLIVRALFCQSSSIIYTRPVDHPRMLCYCTSSRTSSFLFLQPNPHLQMNSGTGPSSPATQGCTAAACSVMRSPGSANQAHGRRGQRHALTEDILHKKLANSRLSES